MGQLVLEYATVLLSQRGGIAAEDKDAFVDPLVEALRDRFELWYDKESTIPGQGSLLQQMSAGLRKSDCGVGVFSEAFFRKKWTQHELDSIFGFADCRTKGDDPDLVQDRRGRSEISQRLS